MAIDFSAFDEKVDLQELQNEVQNAPDNDFADVPDGTYIISIEKMEIKLTKAQDKLMFAVQAKIKEGEQANRMIFFNRVISGNSSAKWTDGQAIKSVCTWVNKLIAEDDTPVEFVNYADFAESSFALPRWHSSTIIKSKKFGCTSRNGSGLPSFPTS